MNGTRKSAATVEFSMYCPGIWSERDRPNARNNRCFYLPCLGRDCTAPHLNWNFLAPSSSSCGPPPTSTVFSTAAGTNDRPLALLQTQGTCVALRYLPYPPKRLEGMR